MGSDTMTDSVSLPQSLHTIVNFDDSSGVSAIPVPYCYSKIVDKSQRLAYPSLRMKSLPAHRTYPHGPIVALTELQNATRFHNLVPLS